MTLHFIRPPIYVTSSKKRKLLCRNPRPHLYTDIQYEAQRPSNHSHIEKKHQYVFMTSNSDGADDLGSSAGEELFSAEDEKIFSESDKRGFDLLFDDVKRATDFSRAIRARIAADNNSDNELFVKSRIGAEVAEQYAKLQGMLERANESFAIKARGAALNLLLTIKNLSSGGLLPGSAMHRILHLDAVEDALADAFQLDVNRDWRVLRFFRWQRIDGNILDSDNNLRILQAAQRNDMNRRVTSSVRAGRSRFWTVAKSALATGGSVLVGLVSLSAKAIDATIQHPPSRPKGRRRPVDAVFSKNTKHQLRKEVRKRTRRTRKSVNGSDPTSSICKGGPSRPEISESLSGLGNKSLNAEIFPSERISGLSSVPSKRLGLERLTLATPHIPTGKKVDKFKEKKLIKGQEVWKSDVLLSRVNGLYRQKYLFAAAAATAFGLGTAAISAVSAAIVPTVTCTAIVATGIAVVEARRPRESTRFLYERISRRSKTLQAINSIIMRAKPSSLRLSASSARKLGFHPSNVKDLISYRSIEEGDDILPSRRDSHLPQTQSVSSKAHIIAHSAELSMQDIAKDAVIDAPSYYTMSSSSSVLGKPLIGALLLCLDSTAHFFETRGSIMLKRLRSVYGVEQHQGSEEWKLLSSFAWQRRKQAD